MEYPPNSKSKPAASSDKRVERVAAGARRKKSLGKQFRETFVAGDAKSAMHQVVFGIMLPSAKDMILDAGHEWLRELMFGDTGRGRRGMRSPSSGATGYISYDKYRSSTMDRPPMPGRNISRGARSKHDFDEIVLESRAEAEEVIDRLFDLVSQWEVARVSDLYELTGLESSHTDNKWGWTDLRGASISRLRNQGYVLDLPTPQPLN